MSKPLTPKTIENAKPREDRYSIPDGDMPGLCIIIQKSGHKSWSYRFRFNDIQYRLKLGTFPPIGLADARELARKAARSVLAGQNPVAEKKAAKQQMLDCPITFEAIARRFLLRACKPNYSECYYGTVMHAFGFRPDPDDAKALLLVRNDYERALVEKWGQRPMDSIGEREILNFLDTIVDEGHPAMANVFHKILRTFFKWAKSPEGHRIITINPCADIKQPAKDNEGERTLEDAELRALWRAALRLGYPHGTAIRLLMLTGARKNLVRLCSSGQIDRQKQTWTIPGKQRGAKGQGYVLPITDALASVLGECGTSAPYLLSTTGGTIPFYIGDILKKKLDILMLEELRKEAVAEGRDLQKVQLPPWTFHDIRRTLRTELSGLEVPDAETVNEAILGHKQAKLRRTYDKFKYLAQKRIALDRWAAKLESIVNPPAQNVVPFRERQAS